MSKAVKEDKYRLPIKQIKIDLVKIFAYAVFSTAVLVAMHLLNIDLEDIVGLIG